MPRSKRETVRLSVFKGRKAKLNRLIFQTLALKGPQTIYDLHKLVKTKRKQRQLRYSSLNRRVRLLEEDGYVKNVGVKKTIAGFEATIYGLTAKAYLATLLNTMNLNELINQADEATATQILGDILLNCRDSKNKTQ